MSGIPRVRLSGAQYKKQAKEKLSREESVLARVPKIDSLSFFSKTNSESRINVKGELNQKFLSVHLKYRRLKFILLLTLRVSTVFLPTRCVPLVDIVSIIS